MTALARIITWRARALYLGPAFELTAHRTGVTVLCCGLGGVLHVARDPRDPRSGWISCRTALVPAGQLHLMQFPYPPIACLYLDPHGEDANLIAASMTRKSGPLATHHSRERALVELLAKAADGQLAPSQLCERVDAICQLTVTTARHPLIESIIQRMRAGPGESHRLATLARGCGLSESRLRHLFKAITGLPFRRFRVWNRLGAGIMVAARGMTLTDAAYHAGFSSAAHFSSAFRAMFGLTPSDLVRTGVEFTAVPDGSPSGRRGPRAANGRRRMEHGSQR